MTDRLGGADSAVDDLALVERFQSGADPTGAIEALFERYGMATYAFFCRRVGDPRIAEELNQDLYVEVIKGLGRFRRQSSFKTWLFRLAYHHLANLRRRWRTHVDEQPAEVPEELWEDLATDDGKDPELRASDEQAKHQLLECLARIPEVERAVIVGRYYENITLRELTEQLNITNPSGARASLIAAQRKLRKCMEKAGFKVPDPN